MRWDSPFVLAAAGTFALHLALVTGGDALVVTHPPRTWVPAPHVELVEVEVPPVLKPPPPPLPSPEPPAPVEPIVPAPRPQAVRAIPSPARAQPPPPPPTETAAPSGGDPVVHMDDIAPSATGVAVASGKPATGRIGRGGSGGGTGAGVGSGTEEIARPVSIATLKTAAIPKGDQSYINIGKDYPAEARELGIGGKINVLVTVDEHGVVTARRLLNRLGHGLDELALEYAAKLEFEPAKDTDDRPVASRLKWTFDMTPPK